MIWTVVLTFVVGIGFGGTKEAVVKCERLACVFMLEADAKKDPAVSRVRVFDGEYGRLPGGATVFPANRDYWLQ